ncbi:ZIP Zinc transporter [Mycoplasmopsis maculosa]|uniref:ZIP Zinc transporter n=1 Tax=Mycoplasmopsis maculosa TaxID=114885 RepID=A0A449B4S2_9BACT|nr:ZIP family metal transporter [Mycoplasmopsis maculosa]VEU75565.1 ZIP Zinc transporter [Mycoplasmopsis maculosa]
MQQIADYLLTKIPDNNNLVYFILVLIVTAGLITLPLIVTLIFAFTKEKLSQKSSVLLYAFICGFFITMALFGFLKESLEVTSLGAGKALYSKGQIYGFNILIVGSGLIGGLLFSYTVRTLIRLASKRNIAKDHEAAVFLHTHDIAHDHSEHNHNKIAPDELDFHKKESESNPSYKLVAILLLLIHRIPEGLLIGYYISNWVSGTQNNFNSLELVFFLSAILHLIPEQILFYYRQREMGWSRAKSIAVSTACLLLFLPAIYIGVYIGGSLNNAWWFNGLIYAFMGGTFLFTSIVEFFPEFYHSHHNKKLFRWTLILFMIGIIIAAIILSIHSHTH